MTMRFLLILAIAALAASSFAKDGDLIQTRLKELAESAKPLADVGFVKAKDGCIWHVSEQDGKPVIVRQLDAASKPYCERTK
jgi:sugar lactone lactonase YvrE